MEKNRRRAIENRMRTNRRSNQFINDFFGGWEKYIHQNKNRRALFRPFYRGKGYRIAQTHPVMSGQEIMSTYVDPGDMHGDYVEKPYYASGDYRERFYYAPKSRKGYYRIGR